MTGTQFAIILMITLLTMTFYQVLKLAADQRRRHRELLARVTEPKEVR